MTSRGDFIQALRITEKDIEKELITQKKGLIKNCFNNKKSMKREAG